MAIDFRAGYILGALWIKQTIQVCLKFETYWFFNVLNTIPKSKVHKFSIIEYKGGWIVRAQEGDKVYSRTIRAQFSPNYGVLRVRWNF